MPIPLETLEDEVLKLPTGERSHLLDRLIASLESDTEVENLWVLEAERRDAEVEGGSVAVVPGPEFIEHLRGELR